MNSHTNTELIRLRTDYEKVQRRLAEAEASAKAAKSKWDLERLVRLGVF